MDSRTQRPGPTTTASSSAKLTYRAEMCRRDTAGRDSTYFDGGDFTPYCVESLLEMLRAETRAPHESLGLTLELKGDCNPATIRELERRFAAIDAPNVYVRICAPGHPPAIVGTVAPGSAAVDAGDPPGSSKTV